MGASEVQGGKGRGSSGMRGYGGRTYSRKSRCMIVDVLSGDRSCGAGGLS